MNHDPGLQPNAAGLRRAEDQCRGGTLADYAELVRGQLGCRAVVIRIAASFARLFSPHPPREAPSGALPVEAPSGASPVAAPSGASPVEAPSGAGGTALYALACDPAYPPLPAPLRCAPALLIDPVTAGDRGFAFHAGLPLRLPSGEALGMLAALDAAPRILAGNELATLRMLADIVVEVAASRLGEGKASEGEMGRS